MARYVVRAGTRKSRPVWCWQAAIGIMGRIAVPGPGMRITIDGIRIRISGVAVAPRDAEQSNSMAGVSALSGRRLRRKAKHKAEGRCG